MTTIITARERVILDPVTLRNVLKASKGTIYTTYEVYENFATVATNRPKSFLLNQMEFDGVVDTVIQVGYNGSKTEIVRTAEELGLDVILFRSMV